MVLSAIGYSNPSLVRYKYIGTVADNCHVAKDIKNENDGCFVYLSGLREVISRSSKINANRIYSWIESEIIPELLNNEPRDLFNEDNICLNNKNTYECNNYGINDKNSFTTFNNEEFGQVRTVLINNEPWFVGKDIAEALGYKNARDALNKHVYEEDKGVAKCDTLGGIQNLTIVNESGLYSLILSSKLASAKKFKRWVTSEVLPELRKTGTYSIQQKQDSYMIEDPAARARRWAEEYEERQRIEQENVKLLEVNDQLQTENDEMRPKAEYHDEVLNKKDLITITVIAKDLGFASGAELNKILIKNKILYRTATGILVPYAKYNWLIEEGYADFASYPDANTRLHLKWTEKGRKWIIENYPNWNK